MSWPARRLFPILATGILVVIGMASTTWWGPAMAGKTAWALPYDLWGTLLAAQRLAHFDIAGLYTEPTSLVSLPGAAVVLIPAALIAEAAGLSLRHPGPGYPHPAVWLLAGPYEILLSAVALFAADALAERLGAGRPRRLVLAAASAIALWSVSVRWGHPEDAAAVGLLLFCVLQLANGRVTRAAWLTGAAIAVQPLVLLAVPVTLAAIEPRRIAGFLARAAAPGALLLAAAAAANWHATFSAVTSQPDSAVINRPTPWTSLAGQVGDGLIAAGPARLLAIAAAAGCALVVGRRWRSRPPGGWPPPVLGERLLDELLWWSALALALRSVFETVMVAYYMWPPLAVALIASSSSWRRLIPASVAATAVTFGSQGSWRSPWTWWLPMITGLLLTLFLAHAKPGPVAEPGLAQASDGSSADPVACSLEDPQGPARPGLGEGP